MKRSTSVLAVLALLIGILGAHASEQWMASADRGAQELDEAKEALLDSAGLRSLHNEIYAKVGEQAWESAVKPDFLSAITQAAARDQGTLFPEWRDVVTWVRTHPAEARRMLQEAAAPRPR